MVEMELVGVRVELPDQHPHRPAPGERRRATDAADLHRPPRGDGHRLRPRAGADASADDPRPAEEPARRPRAWTSSASSSPTCRTARSSPSSTWCRTARPTCCPAGPPTPSPWRPGPARRSSPRSTCSTRSATPSRRRPSPRRRSSRSSGEFIDDVEPRGLRVLNARIAPAGDPWRRVSSAASCSSPSSSSARSATWSSASTPGRAVPDGHHDRDGRLPRAARASRRRTSASSPWRSSSRGWAPPCTRPPSCWSRGRGTTQRPHREATHGAHIDDLTDHVIVCGWGRVGRTIERHLHRGGRRRGRRRTDPERFAAVPGLKVWGDATDDAVMTEAGIERAATVVAAVDSDADNLFVALERPGPRPDLFIVSRVRDEANEAKLPPGRCRPGRQPAAHRRRPHGRAGQHAQRGRLPRRRDARREPGVPPRRRGRARRFGGWPARRCARPRCGTRPAPWCWPSGAPTGTSPPTRVPTR